MRIEHPRMFARKMNRMNSAMTFVFVVYLLGEATAAFLLNDLNDGAVQAAMRAAEPSEKGILVTSILSIWQHAGMMMDLAVAAGLALVLLMLSRLARHKVELSSVAACFALAIVLCTAIAGSVVQPIAGGIVNLLQPGSYGAVEALVGQRVEMMNFAAPWPVVVALAAMPILILVRMIWAQRIGDVEPFVA